MTRPDRLSLGLLVAAGLCCAAPVLVATGLAAAALAVARQHWGWFAAGSGLVAAVVLLRVRGVGAA
jgi:bacteriorhodopsin